MERIVTLGERELKFVSGKVSDHINLAIKRDMSEYRDYRVNFESDSNSNYACTAIANNEVMVLIPVTVPSKNKILAFLAIISTEQMSEKADASTHVRVHSLTLDSKEGNRPMERSLYFEPLQLKLSANNWVALIYGLKGILIANIPTHAENKRHRTSHPCDKPLVCHVIECEALEEQKDLTVLDS